MANTKALVAYLVIDEISEEEKQRKDDQELMIILVPAIAAAVIREDIIKIMGFVEETVPEYHPETFKRFFRMNRQSFESLLLQIAQDDEFKVTPAGRKSITTRKQLLLTLWYLGSSDTTLQIADRFGVTEFSVIHSRDRVVSVICKVVKSKYIVWPSGEEKRRVMGRFKDKKGVPGVIGAIDGSHIRISSPSFHHEKYINRKGFHSLVLQGVCREDARFTHCYTGWPGSVHDARVFRNSDLFDSGPRLCGDGHLVADSAYPLKSWVLTPFRDNGHLTPEQKMYNTCQSSTRVVIEREFGLLKTRFKRLQNLNVKSIEQACDIIMCCCILHNMCILHADFLDEMVADDNGDVAHPGNRPGPNDNVGILKRNAIAANLYRAYQNNQ